MPVKKSSVGDEIEEILARIRENICQLIFEETKKTEESRVAVASKGEENTGISKGTKGVFEESSNDGELPMPRNEASSNEFGGSSKEEMDLLEENKFILNSMDQILLYLTLEQIMQSITSDENVKTQWKQVAIVVNRFLGFTIAVANIGLLIYTGVVIIF